MGDVVERLGKIQDANVDLRYCRVFLSQQVLHGYDQLGVTGVVLSESVVSGTECAVYVEVSSEVWTDYMF